MKKIYLAGPDVFLENAIEIGNKLKKICKNNSYEGIFPLDNEIDDASLSGKNLAKVIVDGNMELIKSCDLVFANLSNFRGSEIHPMCDSGTCWECGYALSLGKTVIGYTNNLKSIPQEISNNIHLVTTISNPLEIEDIFSQLKNIKQKTLNIKNLKSQIFSLDPIFDDVKDINAISSFYLGILKGLNYECLGTLSDTRTQVEKYGTKVDEFITENFDLPANVMIVINTKIN